MNEQFCERCGATLPSQPTTFLPTPLHSTECPRCGHSVIGLPGTPSKIFRRRVTDLDRSTSADGHPHGRARAARLLIVTLALIGTVLGGSIALVTALTISAHR